MQSKETRESLIERLIGSSDKSQQQRLLNENADRLSDSLAESLKERADQLLRHDIAKAQRIAELLMSFSEVTQAPHHRGLALRAQGNIHSIGLGEHESAIPLYDEAAALYRANDMPAEAAKSLIGKVGALSFLGRHDEAISEGKIAANALEAAKEWLSLATTTMNIGIAYGRMGDDRLSLEFFDRAAQAYAELGDDGRPGWLWTQINRGVALRNLGEFSDSLKACMIAKEGLSELGQQVAASRAEQNMALTFIVQGRFNEALNHLTCARDAFWQDGRIRDAMLAELYMTDCQLQLGRYQEVLEKVAQIRKLFEGRGEKSNVGQAIYNEAVAHFKLSNIDEAAESFQEAREIFEEESNEYLTSLVDIEIARIRLLQGNFAKGRDLATKCAQVFRNQGHVIAEARSAFLAAHADSKLGDCESARNLIVNCLEDPRISSIPALRFHSSRLLGSLSEASHDYPEALKHFDDAIKEAESMRFHVMVEYRTSFIADKQAAFEDATHACLELQLPDRALEYAERAKSRALIETFGKQLNLSVVARDQADQSIVDEIDALRTERDLRYRRWRSATIDRERSPERGRTEDHQAIGEVANIEKRITHLWHELLIRNADYASNASLWITTYEPAHVLLPEDTAAIEYYAVRGSLVAFVVTRDWIEAFTIEQPLEEISGWIRRLALSLQAVPYSSGEDKLATQRTKEFLTRLHSALLRPLIDRIGGFERIVIVPHGELHYLPFHALHDGNAYLIEQHEVSYLPSLSLLTLLENTQSRSVGAVSVGYSNGGQIPNAVLEANSVAEALEGDVLLEDQATRTRFREAIEGQAIVHYAGHGEFRSDNPLFSGVLLADGLLTTLDIFNLDLSASLVTLSGCETGRTVVQAGDDLAGLMRAFFYAGARSLVMSLWPVDDRSTASLMEQFYAKLRIGADKSASLREAQLAFARSSAATQLAHPYHWAAFCLVGHWGPLQVT